MKLGIKMIKELLLSLTLISSALFAIEPIDMPMVTAKGKKLDLRIDDFGLKVQNRWGNKALLLVFFGTHCPACDAEMPALKKIHKETKDLIVLGIQTEDNVRDKELVNFAKQKKLNYPVVNFSYSMELIDFIRTNLKWGGEIPKIYLFDRSGKYQKDYTGALSKEQLLSDLREIRYGK
jgi:thiol-disulfide isomerase/thioredoxin